MTYKCTLGLYPVQLKQLESHYIYGEPAMFEEELVLYASQQRLMIWLKLFANDN